MFWVQYFNEVLQLVVHTPSSNFYFSPRAKSVTLGRQPVSFYTSLGAEYLQSLVLHGNSNMRASFI